MVETPSAQLDAFARLSPVGIFRADANGQCVYVDPRWCEITGLGFDAALGHGWLDSLHPDDRARVAEDWRQAAMAGRPFDAEYRVRHPDGRIARVRGRAVAEHADNRVSGYVGTITELTDPAATPPLSAMSFRTMIESVTDLILVLDDQGVVRYGNPSVGRLLGWEPQDCHGRPVTDFVHPDDVPAVRAALARALAAPDIAQDLEHRFRRRDGGWIVVHSVGRCILDEHGIPLVVISARDITPNPHADAALQRYRLLAEQTTDIVLFYRQSDGRLIDVNRAAVRAYGRSHEALLACTIHDLQEDEPVPPPADGKVVETWHRCADGSRFSVEVTSIAAVIEGEPCVVSTVRDVTRRRRRQAVESIVARATGGVLGGASTAEILQTACDELVRRLDLAAAWMSLRDSGRTPPVHVRSERPDLPAAERRRSITFPLVSGSRVLGTLNIEADTRTRLDEETLQDVFFAAEEIARALVGAEQQDRVRLLETALEAAANAVVITDRHGVIEWVNASFTRLTGYMPREVVGQTPRILKSGSHGESFYRQMWEAITRGEVWRGEMFNRRKDGTVYAEEQTVTPVRSGSGEITHFIAIKLDITERRQQQERMVHLAMHDALTDLPNRRVLQETLERVVTRARRGRRGACLLLDLDHFKIVNDTVGHPAGDQLLRRVAQALRGVLRPADFLARLGGDEFAVVLEDTPPEAASAAAERLRRAVEECRFEFGGHRFDVTASLGLVPIDGGLDPQRVLSLVDTALYAAKQRGRNRVAVYDADVDPKAILLQTARWATRIKDALREQRCALSFQPIVRLATGEIACVEAFLRVRDADGSLIPTGELIATAERFGLIAEVDRWVFDAALEAAAAHPGPVLFINVSGVSLADEAFVSHVEQRLREGPVDGSRMGFEITESAIVADVVQATRMMGRLKRLGCRFALDDFGVGFASFGYLRSLPADYVKLCQTSLHGMESDAATRALVHAVASVARALGKETVAEGVETPEAARLLQELGVGCGQGYFWDWPRPEWPVIPA